MINKTSVAIFLKLLLISTLYLPNTFAQYQDYMQLNLPEGAKARFGKGWISGEIAYSADGTKLAASSSIGIWIYDANTYAEVALLTGHTYYVNSVAFSPDGKKLVSGGHDGTVQLWDVNTRQLLHVFEGQNIKIYDVAFSPDGKMFAGIDNSRRIRLWDADTGQLLLTRKDPNNSIYWNDGIVNCLAFSSDSKWIAAGYTYGRIRWFDVSTGEYLWRSNFSAVGVNDLAFSSDGVTLAIGSGNDNVYLLGARTGKRWQTLRGHRDGVNTVVFSPDGKTLASGSDDQTVRLWDAFTGEHLRTIEGHTSSILGVSFSTDGSILVSASWTEIRFWDGNTGQLLHTLEGHTRPVYSVALSPDSKTLASGYKDSTIQLLDVATGKHKQTLMGHEDAVFSVVFSPDGKTIASGAGDLWSGSRNASPALRLWDLATSEVKFERLNRDVYSIAFSPDGKTLASGSVDQVIRLWDRATGEHTQTFFNRNESGIVRSVSFSPDGEFLVSGSSGVHIWHLHSGRLLRTLVNSTLPINAVRFSPDGSTIIGSVDNEIWFWNSRSGEHLWTLKGHKWAIQDMALSPDGITLASASWQEIRLWDAATGEHKDTFMGHTGWVLGVSFSPDGTTLASGSGDGTILLWDLIPSDTTDNTPSTPATSDATVSISATPVQSPTIGELLTFPLNITDGENVAGYQATVEFDTTALRYVSSENGDYLPSGAFFVPPVVDGNKVTLAASSLASESNGDGTLATLTFELVAAKTSTLKLSEVNLVDSDGVRSYPNIEENTQIEIIEAPYAPEDVNEDGIVNILDLVAVASNFGQTGENIADVNEDGVVDIVDLVLVAGALGSDAAAPSVWDRDLEVGLTHADVQQWLTQARGLDLTDAAQKGIIFLEQLLEILTPKETTLLPNYPNPFNPETWIPYQLAEPADVSFSIYSADGKLIRTLDLGHQPIGIYESRSRAAYWDGKNAIGEPVASGVYFYTLTAGEFTATRKMLIRK